MSTKTTSPVFHKFSELDINPSLSGRSDKEIRENAKLLAKEMEAHGEWDVLQPGQVAAVKDGNPRVVAGFTRIAAAQLCGYKGGWFFEIEDASELDLRLKCITTNGGKPVNRFQQGCLFQLLGAGVAADDFAGTTGDPAKPEDWKIAPMNDTRIAEKIGMSREHVRQCIVICESSPDIRTLIETDQISYNVVVKARTWAKGEHGVIDDVKALKALRGAIREAGGEKVTLKHLEAVKATYFPLKAVWKKKGKEKVDDPDAKDEKKENTGDSGHDEERGSGGSEPQELNLGATDSPKPPTPKRADNIRAELVALLTKFDGKISNVDSLADWLIVSGVIVAEMPF